jgi:hypothetical protein
LYKERYKWLQELGDEILEKFELVNETNKQVIEIRTAQDDDSSSSAGKPEMQTKPEQGSSQEVWFNWYPSMLDRGFNCGLKDKAKETNLSYGYIRQLHARYASPRGLSKPKKKN